MRIKLYICPKCGQIRPTSRKTSVECANCEGIPMESIKLSFEKYTLMSQEERNDYAQGWLYIHKKAQGT